MMPSIGLVRVGRRSWLPPIPLPLFLLWPLVLLGRGIARLLERDRPVRAGKLRTAMQLFRELRGLAIDVRRCDRRRVWIRFL